MRIKNLAIFLLIIIVAGLSTFTAFNGLRIGEFEISPISEVANLGLDLKGGVFVVYEADTDATGRELDEQITQTIEVFRRRVDSMGLTEPSIVREGDNRIRVELPGVEDAQEALDMIGRTAQLQFLTPEGDVILTGGNVRRSEVTYIKGQANPVVNLEFDSEGTRNFAEATEEFLGQSIFIVLDDEVISDPTIRTVISNGVGHIDGGYTVEEASTLASLIRAGALPVELEEVRSSTVTASLGVNALQSSVRAALIGIVLVLLFMLIVYVIPGFIANIALIFYILFVVGIMVVLNATWTLPGIAALILSVGMAVDANVIIFERIKEEIRLGKTIRSSIDAGFKRAFRAILDSNVTTLIAGVVLYQFGTGPIRGFAITLMIGIVVSLFTAIVITRFLLKLTVNMNLTNNIRYFGVQGGSYENNRK
ncbi:protein translocase subunit SecD [Serpentinicella sp. ANB-PHB4]|uniref:protein translocase subunit SecD n=1 Tax=Serpentinicella sp. ANB-PHB4 TaxID=3074076 RepID=UPI0028622D98|nr:protein translocase subunit SecD [Serpentinicella sp. ANB-PHB4]MDR5658065.1 protein translocase subunit SecD [Serpentinicella sp. ANB-PHB4]